MTDELKDLVGRIKDSNLRSQILRNLERKGEITPQALLEQVEPKIMELNAISESIIKLQQIPASFVPQEEAAPPIGSRFGTTAYAAPFDENWRIS
jgi:hypothetical protein